MDVVKTGIHITSPGVSRNSLRDLIQISIAIHSIFGSHYMKLRVTFLSHPFLFLITGFNY